MPTTSPPTRVRLPGPADRFLTGAGIGTELSFHQRLDLPFLSTAVLLETPAGRRRLRAYYRRFVALARSTGRGLLLETPTWRNNRDWAERLGHDELARGRLDQVAVRLLQGLRLEAGLPPGRFVISGTIGPRFDAYDGRRRMPVEIARAYHQEQVDTLAAAGVDAVSAMTMTNAAEAVGIARACARVGVPAVVSFTLETDGRLPCGTPLGEAIERVDAQAPGAVAYYGINCTHPTHFDETLRVGGAWTARIGMLRANASRKSHAELDGCTRLDAGDPAEFGRLHRALQGLLPGLRVLGGCCGTDLRHVRAVVRACDRPRRVPQRLFAIASTASGFSTLARSPTSSPR